MGLGSSESRLNRSLPVRRICSSSFLCRFMSERTLSRRASRFWLRAELPGEGNVRNAEGSETVCNCLAVTNYLGNYQGRPSQAVEGKVQRPQGGNREVCSKTMESWRVVKDEAKEMGWTPDKGLGSLILNGNAFGSLRGGLDSLSTCSHFSPQQWKHLEDFKHRSDMIYVLK